MIERGEAIERRRARARRRTAIRRRRAGVGAVAGVALILGLVVGAGAGAGGAGEPTAVSGPTCPPEIAAEPRRLAGQMLVVRMEDRATPELIRTARRGEIGGVILFPTGRGEPEEIASEVRRLQQAARAEGNPPLLVMTDQEGGGVKRFPLAPPQRSPIDLGDEGSRREALLEGQATGNFLAELGIDVDLAPVLDIPASELSAIAMRAFGSDPQRVSRLGVAFAEGLAEEGVIAVPKHFPGLGRADVSTDVAAVTIDAPAHRLRRDLEPFREAVGNGAEMIMVSLAIYPAYGTQRPAALSTEIVSDLLRRQLGFAGVVIADDLEAPAIAGAGLDESQAAVAAAEAGVDLLLFALGGGADALPALTRAIGRDRLHAAVVEGSCARIVDLKRRGVTDDE
jgi:beta-N-acetylhexosaminidase